MLFYFLIMNLYGNPFTWNIKMKSGSSILFRFSGLKDI
jgi:hypothetical protein